MKDGIFTLENISTGEYRTFKIETQGPEAKFAPGQQVISLLSGPANQHDYQSFGFVYDVLDSPRVVVWKSKFGENGEKSEYQKIAILLGLFWNEATVTARYRRIDPVPCARCGELLTVPRSVDRGVGPHCARQG